MTSQQLINFPQFQKALNKYISCYTTFRIMSELCPCVHVPATGDWDPGEATGETKCLSPAAGGIHFVHTQNESYIYGGP